MDILEWDSNGSTIKDAAGNIVYPAGHNEFRTPNYFSDKHTIAIDTERPVITVSPVVENKVSATVTDNLDDDPAAFLQSQIISGSVCGSSTPGIFTTYTAGSELTLPIGSRACFKVRDVFHNVAYEVSGPGTAPPTVTVTPAAAHSTLKREITVSASSSSPGLVASSWKHKNLAGLAACNAAALHRFFAFGAQMTLDDEAYNGNRVCFGVKDDKGNWGYAASGLITGIDRTAPIITPNPSSADSTPKREITVTADSGSTDVDNGTWRHKVILGSSACNAAAMSSHTSSGRSITLASESHNNRKVCFAVQDNADNWAYAASGLISGIDRTAPIITVSSVVANKVSATISGGHTTFESQVISDNVCSSSTGGTFAAYNAGSELSLLVGTRACFKASDSLTNTRYVASGVGVDTTTPVLDTTPPAITVSPAAAHSTPKRELRVIASSPDGDVASSSWKHKVVSSTTCNASEMSSATSSGRSITLAAESYNNRRVCFAVKDTSDNWAYAASGLITGIDRTAPIITPNPSSADSTPKREITVTADSGSTDVDNGTWRHKVILGSSACNAAAMSSHTSSGRSITLASESHNNRKVCFAVQDNADNWAYLASGLISGIDRSAPSIAVSSVTDNKVSALVSDTNSPTLESLLISHSSCSLSTLGTFASYSAGTDLTLSAGIRACFKATDSVGNVSYAASGVGVATAPGVVDPVESLDELLPTINISTVANNRISATLSGDLSNSPMLEFLIISDNLCGSSTVGSFAAYTLGTTLTLPIGSRACFKVTDNAGRAAYAVSAAGKKKRSSRAPSSSNDDPQAPDLEVSVLTGDTISATDNYPAATTMYYRIQSDDGCDSNFEGAFNIYQEGTSLDLSVADDYYVCFKTVDNDDSDNVAYSISALIVVDEAEPQQAAPPIDGHDDGDQPPAVDPLPLPAPSTAEPGGNVDPDPADNGDDSNNDNDDESDDESEDEAADTSSTPSSDSNSNIAFLLILLGASLLAAALIVIIIKKRSSSQEL